MEHRIDLKNISQSFEMNGNAVTLFEQLNLSICQGQSYAITGPSGAGKSSLLMLASGLEKPTTGQCVAVNHGREFPIAELRAEVGFIFQQFHLLPELTALNNVALPLKLRGDNKALAKAKQWLEHVGLSHRLDHKPSELSGGEQQRVAIARALVFKPKFIFADEPTGNLDPKSAAEVAKLLISCCQQQNAALVMVTHSDALASRAEHIYSLAGGTLSLKKSVQAKELLC
ncbi:ABC transporter ATP-binding protein [Thalassotalea sp. PLHSN55]|uniref:ABC transporter ATP-binding protein n=1 Tax=Thalassotalea sp. PLHSN55 TaxID=3435888 RepID=UPI003F8700E7